MTMVGAGTPTLPVLPDGTPLGRRGRGGQRTCAWPGGVQPPAGAPALARPQAPPGLVELSGRQARVAWQRLARGLPADAYLIMFDR